MLSNIFITILFIFLPLFSGSDKAPIVEYSSSLSETEIPSLQMVENNDPFSDCMQYQLQHDDGSLFSIDGMTDFYCDAPSFSPAKDLIIYDDGVYKKLFSFEKNASETLLDATQYEGVSGPYWSPEGTAFAFVLIDQQRIDTATRVLVFSQEKNWKEPIPYDVKMNMECASICFVDDKSIFFLDEDRIQYATWNELPFDLEGESGARILLTQ